MNTDNRAELGVDGNCGFALLGPDLQEGESEFVEIVAPDDGDIASRKALQKLRDRLGRPDLSYFIGPSHPKHC